MEITLETLPKAVANLTNEITEIKRLILELCKSQKPDSQEWMDINRLCEYLPDKPKKATVYGWINEDKIPSHKGNGTKKRRFLKSEIDAWLLEGKSKTLAELTRETEAYIKGGGHKW